MYLNDVQKSLEYTKAYNRQGQLYKIYFIETHFKSG